LLKVLVFIIAILFHRVIGIGIGNTFLTWYWYGMLQYFFTSIVNNPVSGNALSGSTQLFYVRLS